MSKFNRNVQARVNSPIKSPSVADGRTHEGALAFSKDMRSELFLHAVGSFFGESTFYQSSEDRVARLNNLSRAVAIEDVEWLTNFVHWLRHDGNVRSAPLAVALEGIHARLKAERTGNNRQLVTAALQRGDEGSEAVAYWSSNFGRSLPKPLKRAVADFLNGVNSYSFNKYGKTGSFKYRDLLRLTHPKPKDLSQDALFKYVLEKEDALLPEDIALRQELLKLPVEDRANVSSEQLKAAGFTWEQYAGWLQGEVDWNKIIPSMGYMALLRNLRNFEQANIKSIEVANKISDPVQVKRSRQFPFRFVSAYKELESFFYLEALEIALGLSLENIPKLQGRTLILVDQSDSMTWHLSEKSKMTWMETAALFGSAIAKRAEDARLWQFGSYPIQIANFHKPILRLVKEDFKNLGGTDTRLAFADATATYPNADRIILLSDEQTSRAPKLPTDIPVYIWNFVGYTYGYNASLSNVHTFGGLNDNSFRMIQLLEAGKNARWPWENNNSSTQ